MKTLTRVAFYAMAISSVSFSYSYAQEPVDLAPDMASEEVAVEEGSTWKLAPEDVIEEDDDKVMTLEEAKQAIAELPGAKDAVKGAVKTESDEKLYDIYGRQLAYRENEKEFRASLEKRRENFEKPREELVKKIDAVREKVYAAETADYQNKLMEDSDAGDEMLEEDRGDEMHKIPTGEAVPAEPQEEEIGLKEEAIPGEYSDADAQVVKRKVVTSEDAPQFDPARLNEDLDPAAPAQEDGETLPMPAPSKPAVPAEKAQMKSNGAPIEVAPQDVGTPDEGALQAAQEPAAGDATEAVSPSAEAAAPALAPVLEPDSAEPAQDQKGTSADDVLSSKGELALAGMSVEDRAKTKSEWMQSSGNTVPSNPYKEVEGPDEKYREPLDNNTNKKTPQKVFSEADDAIPLPVPVNAEDYSAPEQSAQASTGERSRSSAAR